MPPHHVFSKQMLRLAVAPIGAATTVTAANGGVFAFGENVSSKTSTRIANSVTKLSVRRFAAAAPPPKDPLTAAKGAVEATTSASTTASARQMTTSSLPRVDQQAAAAATQQQQSSVASFVQWYEGHLATRPVQTKMVTGSILWGLGDGVAQVIPAVSSSQPLDYDLARTGRAVFFGFAIHAPTSHLHYNCLEWMTQKAGVQGLGVPVFKAFMEQFVYWSWFSNSLYHGAMGAMQGHAPGQIYQRINDVLWETQKAQWVFWIPVQLLNFRFVPVRHQLNVVLLTSVVWTALLSAWYPPEEQTHELKDADDATHEKTREQQQQQQQLETI